MEDMMTPMTDATIVNRKQHNSPRPLNESVKEAIEYYLLALGDLSINNLYATVISEIESSMLQVVLKKTKYNQTQAARILGISRSTLRKKLKQYQINGKSFNQITDLECKGDSTD